MRWKFESYLQSTTGKGTGGGVGTETRADRVGDSNGDQFLVGIDLVSVNTAKGWNSQQ